MSPRREDLLELSPQALAALANPGFVKRAQKDLAEGRLPEIGIGADAVVHARYEDGHAASLAPGQSLRDARCSCPATGLCRHRVTLVLAYQQWVEAEAPPPQTSAASEDAAGGSVTDVAAAADAVAAGPMAGPAWSPAEFDEAALAALLPPALLEQAKRLAAARPVVRLQAWQPAAPTPTAHLPLCSVRFFSRLNLAHARCDCRLGGHCEHVALAVWAFRQGGGLHDAVIELLPPAAAVAAAGMDADALAACAQVQRFLRRLWLDGSSQPWLPLEADYAALRENLLRLGWNWPLECLDELRELVLAQAARSSRFDPLRLLQVLAELPARLLAARQAAQSVQPRLPARQILGIGVRGEVALDHLKLVSLGLQCWSDATADGARVLFADPDTLAVTVLERSWPREAGQAPVPVLSRRVAGQGLRQLAAAQVVTRGARRRANGLVEISATARQTSVLPLSAQSWDGLGAPLRQPGGAALRRHLRDAPPDFVRPRQAIAHVHVLPVAAVLGWGWDAAAQTLYAELLCREATAQNQAEDADRVQLWLAHEPAAPAAVDVLAALLADAEDPPLCIASTVALRGGTVWLAPLAVATARRAVVLQASAAAAQTLRPAAGTPAPDGLTGRLVGLREEFVLWARQGMRHQTPAALQRLEREAGEIAARGLPRLAGLLRDLLADWRSAVPADLADRLASLLLLLQDLLCDTDLAEPVPSV